MDGTPTTGVARVLYVEDEECDRIFMEQAFRKAGIGKALWAVMDGREAMRYLAGNGVYADRVRHPMPSVVLLDLNLPLVSGFDVLKWMRGRQELAALPVVVFSSSMRDEDREKAHKLGANEYVAKPQTLAGFGEVAQRLRERWLAQVKAPSRLEEDK